MKQNWNVNKNGSDNSWFPENEIGTRASPSIQKEEPCIKHNYINQEPTLIYGCDGETWTISKQIQNKLQVVGKLVRLVTTEMIE